MNYKDARTAMVESQIRPNNVRSPDVLNAFATIPRESFLPEHLAPVAYVDKSLAIEDGPITRFILAPMTLGRMLENVSERRNKALDVGGVTGYSAAILAHLYTDVIALETSEHLIKNISARLTEIGINNVSTASGSLADGYVPGSPYDLILLNGGVLSEPKAFFSQLAEGGRLLCVVGTPAHGQAYVFIKNGQTVSGKPLFDIGAEILPGFESKPQFVF